jgi:hypothetical protein
VYPESERFSIFVPATLNYGLEWKSFPIEG